MTTLFMRVTPHCLARIAVDRDWLATLTPAVAQQPLPSIRPRAPSKKSSCCGSCSQIDGRVSIPDEKSSVLDPAGGPRLAALP